MMKAPNDHERRIEERAIAQERKRVLALIAAEMKTLTDDTDYELGATFALRRVSYAIRSVPPVARNAPPVAQRSPKGLTQPPKRTC